MSRRGGAARRAAAVALLAATIAGGCGHEPTAPMHSGPPASLQIVTGNAQTGIGGELLADPLTVQVLDAAGRGVAGVVVDWQVANGGSLFARAFPMTTDSVGLALVLWQLGPLLGSQSVTAVCCGFMEVPFTAHALLPLAQRLTVDGGGFQSDTVGRTLPLPVVARVLRADGTPDTGVVVGWGTRAPGAHISPTLTRTDSAGHASTTWTLGTVAGQETSWVQVQGLPQLLVFASASPGPATRLVITPNPLPIMGLIGDNLYMAAQAWDQYGNLEQGTIALAAADTTVIGVNASTYQVSARHHGATWLTAQIGTLRDSAAVTVLGFSAVSQGAGRRCGVSLAGGNYCWGLNTYGALGDGTEIDRPRPVLIAQGLGLGLPRTEYHTCALTASGQAYCWGYDGSGELGDGSPTYATEWKQTLPVVVAGSHVFSSVSAGAGHTCAVSSTGDAYCWGSNFRGQLGRDTLTQTCDTIAVSPNDRCSDWPILVSGGLKFAQVSAGAWYHSCGVTATGAAYCWGLNDWGQLGNDSTPRTCAADTTTSCSFVPRLVQGGVAFKSLKAGGRFSCGLAVSGDAYCWGFGSWGALGNGGTASTSLPVKVSGGLTFVDVQAGVFNACGLTASGTLYCWGNNYPATPTALRPDLHFGALAVGGEPGCALTTMNDLYCFQNPPY